MLTERGESAPCCFLLWGTTHIENQKQKWWQMQREVDVEED